MSWMANGAEISDNILRDKATYLALNPVIYSQDIPGTDTSVNITGNETFIYNG